MLHKNDNDINCRNISLFAASRNIAVGGFYPKKDPVVNEDELYVSIESVLLLP